MYSLSICKFPFIFPTTIYVSSFFITSFSKSAPVPPKFIPQSILPSWLYFANNMSVFPLLNNSIFSPVDVCSALILNFPVICPTAICPPLLVSTAELYCELLLTSLDTYSTNPLLLYIKVTFPNSSKSSPNVV